MPLSAIQSCTNWTCSSLHASLLPAHGSLTQKTTRYVLQIFQFLLSAPAAGFCCLLSGVESFVASRPVAPDSPLVAFAKHPTWERGNNPQEEMHWAVREGAKVPEIPVGAATAAFHDNGPKRHEKTQFGKLYNEDHPELMHDDFKFPNMWENPELFLEKIKELNLKTFRFSVPRDLVEVNEGVFQEEAISKVVRFCERLKALGVKPIVTLEHFTRPDYQTFENDEGIDSFVNYAEKITDVLYQAGVRTIVTFNEVGVDPFQGFMMGAFPPYSRLDCEGAARVFFNMMKAHTRVYQAIKKGRGDLEVGFSHDPIRFRYFHKYNLLWSPIERLVSKVLTLVNHTMVMRALKTQEVSLKIPFLSNYSASLEEPIPFDFIGLQYYSDPLVQLSFFGGNSVSRVPGEKISAYQFRQYAQGLASAIEEMTGFHDKPIHLTEIGIDTGINKTGDDDHERIAYFNRIFQVVQRALDEGKKIESLELWTLIDNFDWHQGWTLPDHCPIRFGLYRFDHLTGDIAPRGLVPWLQRKLAGR